MYKRMKPAIFLLTALMFTCSVQAQNVTANLTKAWSVFEADSQLKSAIASIYVLDAATGKVVFEKNSRIGLAPASTQKIITAAAAFELLGKDFRYTTSFGYSGGVKSGRLSGSLVVVPSGDPTLGSWRWAQTSETAVAKRVVAAVARTGIQSFQNFSVAATGWESETIPGGWIWDDIGNYYGAGAAALNWRENQYDLILKSGLLRGDSVSIVGTVPTLYGYRLASKVKAAAKGTGDNAYIYFPLAGNEGVVRGTIPVGENAFKISGAMPSAQRQFLATLTDSLSRRGIAKEFAADVTEDLSTKNPLNGLTVFHTETSPPLDSICYWFLKRSINLYGEALAKTLALRAGKTASTSNGADIIQDFWSSKNLGIDKSELHLYDGSGLSPLNRTTTHAQATTLQYAKKQSWFKSYVACFPEFNAMTLKSGTISRVKSFCGYPTSKDGREYIVSFILNNYEGSSSAVVQKMYRVLDVLK